MDEFKELILNFLKKETNLENIELEIPPNPEMGDYAFPCFVLAKEWKKSPNEIANELSERFKPTNLISEAKAIGPYLNFFVNKSKIAEDIIKEVLKQKEKYGSSNIGKNKKILVEHTSINPNASPHLGRARNAILGDSIVRILKFQDYKIETHYLVNDIGKQIAMLVLAAKGKNPSFSELLKLYIGFNKKLEKNEGLEKEVFYLLNKVENNDKKTISRFKKIVNIAVKGQTKILRELNIKFDKFDYESSYLTKTSSLLNKL